MKNETTIPVDDGAHLAVVVARNRHTNTDIFPRRFMITTTTSLFYAVIALTINPLVVPSAQGLYLPPSPVIDVPSDDIENPKSTFKIDSVPPFVIKEPFKLSEGNIPGFTVDNVDDDNAYGDQPLTPLVEILDSNNKGTMEGDNASPVFEVRRLGGTRRKRANQDKKTNTRSPTGQPTQKPTSVVHDFNTGGKSGSSGKSSGKGSKQSSKSCQNYQDVQATVYKKIQEMQEDMRTMALSADSSCFLTCPLLLLGNPCNICGSDGCVQNPDGTFEDGKTCGSMQEYLFTKDAVEFECIAYQRSPFLHNCQCGGILNTAEPSGIAINIPSGSPSQVPSGIQDPSAAPTNVPTNVPSTSPSSAPSNVQSKSPSQVPSNIPSNVPSKSPSIAPSNVPSKSPSIAPSNAPSKSPSIAPSNVPSTSPSSAPSDVPSTSPSSAPSDVPSKAPSSAPSNVPSKVPSQVPSNVPSKSPSQVPSNIPSKSPSQVPSNVPSKVPSQVPSHIPSKSPSSAPSNIPSKSPSQVPSNVPSKSPSHVPSNGPSKVPSQVPSHIPSKSPSSAPSNIPSKSPSSAPSDTPSTTPSGTPITVPTWCADGWVQLGQEILGESKNDEAGSSVAMSSDGLTVAVGAAYDNNNTDESKPNSGSVRVFTYDSVTNKWVPLGQEILGESADDNAGYSVAISSNGDTVAVGARYDDNNNDESKPNSGSVRVFTYDSVTNEWVPLGQEILGESAYDNAGYSVAMSSDGLTVAVGAVYDDNTSGSKTDYGSVRVFTYDSVSNEWVQLGQEILGESAGDHAGWSIAVSSNGKTVAVGAAYDDNTTDESKTDFGSVRVFTYDSVTNKWVPLGQEILGESAGDNAGYSVAISSNGLTVAVGAMNDDDTSGSKPNSGSVRVFTYDSVSTNKWVQLGQEILGESAYDNAGYSVAISSDGLTVTVGVVNDNDTAGSVRVFTYDSITNIWVPLGQEILGQSEEDNAGYSVAMSANGGTVAVGAVYDADTAGSKPNSGSVRICRFVDGSQ
jgi:hypothetical protein